MSYIKRELRAAFMLATKIWALRTVRAVQMP